VEVLGRFWERVTETVPDLPSSVLLSTAAVAALLVLSPALWRPTRHVVTIAHEGAHGLVALAAGRRLSGIRLHSDTSGLTVSAGRPTGLGMVLTCAAGYTGPGLFGLGAAALLATGHAVGLLWALLGLLALLLVQIRNWYGLWSVLVTGGVVFAATWWLPADGRPPSPLWPPGSCCWLRPGPCWSCSAAVGGAGPPTPTPTSWPGSPACPRWCGSASSSSSTSAPWCWEPTGCWPERPQSRRRRFGAQPIGWRTGSTFGGGGISRTTSSCPTVTWRPWCRMSSGSPSSSR
jgi:hypothetical protein